VVPSNILHRTFRIQFAGQVGTCFTLDVEGKQYIVTARHVLPNAAHQATVQIQHESKWADLPCVVVGVGEGEVDIAVLAPPHVISPSLPLEPTTKAMFLSQDAYFLGFPYGLHAEVGALNANFPLPLVKKACVSLFALSGNGPCMRSRPLARSGICW
jgi:S1-C subfamily serine protease